MKISLVNDIMSENDEKILLINLVGIFETLKSGGLSINEAEKFLFSPHMVGKLRAQHCNEKIIDILEKGCEIEDVASLIPRSLLRTINELEKATIDLMKSYKDFNKTFWLKE